MSEPNPNMTQAEQVIQERRASECYRIAKRHHVNPRVCTLSGLVYVPVALDQLEARVIEDDREGQNCYHYARDIRGANIEALQARVLEVGSAIWCLLFARDIKGADIPALQSRVMARGTIEDLRLFATMIKGADKEAIRDRIEALSGEALKACAG